MRCFHVRVKQKLPPSLGKKTQILFCPKVVYLHSVTQLIMLVSFEYFVVVVKF